MRFRLPAAIALAAFALTSCAQEEILYVDKGWVRLPAVEGNPAAAYFRINGGVNDDKLIRVSAELAIKSEMHDTVEEGGVTKMVQIESVDIPAKGSVEFKPGGKHLMLYDLRPHIKAGDTVKLDFVFASGEKLYIEAPVQAAGTPEPGHEGH